MVHIVQRDRGTSQGELTQQYRGDSTEEPRWAWSDIRWSRPGKRILTRSPTPETPYRGGFDLPCVSQTLPVTSVLRLERCFRFRSSLWFPSLIN